RLPSWSCRPSKKIGDFQWNKIQSIELLHCDGFSPKVAFSSRAGSSILSAKMEEPMRKLFGRLAGTLLALALSSGLAAAQSKVTIAVGGGGCLCYLPTLLAKQLGEYEKAGVAVDLVDLK